jgi:hypothetical protein
MPRIAIRAAVVMLGMAIAFNTEFDLLFKRTLEIC